MRYLIYLFGGMLILSSCREKIDFDLNDDLPRLVIDATMSTDYKRHKIEITKTSSFYNQQEAEKISGAQVTVSDGTQNIVFNELMPGVYLSDSVAAQVGKTYQLNVTYQGESYMASSSVFPVSQLDSIVTVQEFDTIPIINEVDSTYSLGIAITEQAGLGDYYLFKYYINGFLESDTIREYSFTEDTFIDGISFDFNPLISVYQIDHDNVQSGDLITLEIHSISEDYLDYLAAVLLQTEFRQGTIFDGPASNVGGNISNGALGYFFVSDVSRASTNIP